MKHRYRIPAAMVVVLLLMTTLGSIASFADGSSHETTYRVTVHNVTRGQPLTPPLAATHRRGIHMFQKWRLASPELEAIAENGDAGPMTTLLAGSDEVTAVASASAPLTPRGRQVGDFTDTVTFEINARPGDRISLAAMLVCTNDGFVGLDSVRLPRRGSRVFWLRGYDAGTEDNTERSTDIVDPCSDLGPMPLPGDPNGNENDAVDTVPAQRIRRHARIKGVGELSARGHGWFGPAAVVKITRIDH